MIGTFRNGLVLASHTDEAELGAGGTIAKLIQIGTNVTYVTYVTYVNFFTASEPISEGLPKGILKTELRAATKKPWYSIREFDHLQLSI